MTKVIVVTNRKGGVGKTTVATHLAGGLALNGSKVALVDTDPQGHAALAVGVPKANGLYNVMTNEAMTLSDVLVRVDPIRYTPPGRPLHSEFWLLPSDRASALIPIEQPDPFRFKSVLNDLGELLDLDYIIVDTGPTTSMFDGSVNFAADHFVIVTECARLSFDGLTESLNEMKKINHQNARYRPNPSTLLGIVPNKARVNTRNQRDNLQELAQAFPDIVWSPVVLRTIWEEAMQYGQLVYSYAPDGYEVEDANRIVQNVLRSTGAVIPA